MKGISPIAIAALGFILFAAVLLLIGPTIGGHIPTWWDDGTEIAQQPGANFIDTGTIFTNAVVTVDSANSRVAITFTANDIDTPLDGQCSTFDSASGGIEWELCGGGSGGATNTADQDGTPISLNWVNLSIREGLLGSTSSTDLRMAVSLTTASLTDDRLLIGSATGIGAEVEFVNCVGGSGFVTYTQATNTIACTFVVTGDITDGTIIEVDLNAVDAPVDEECLTYEAPGFEWQACGGSLALNDLTDVIITTSTLDVGQHLQFDGATWTNDYPRDLFLRIRNESGSTINLGDLVHISGYSIGQDLPLVSLADADNPATMPAIGLVYDSSIANNAAGEIVISGRLSGFDTSSCSAGDVFYASITPGALTCTRPTGAGTLVQSVGEILRSHATLGVIEIHGADQNDLPNLADGDIWLGNGSDVATETDVTDCDLTAQALNFDATTRVFSCRTFVASDILAAGRSLTLANPTISADEELYIHTITVPAQSATTTNDNIGARIPFANGFTVTDIDCATSAGETTISIDKRALSGLFSPGTPMIKNVGCTTGGTTIAAASWLSATISVDEWLVFNTSSTTDATASWSASILGVADD